MPGELVADAKVGRLRLLVDPGDGGSRDDVVELEGQHLPPQLVEGAGRTTGHGRPQLGLAQQTLAALVPELGAQLARERAAMGLEVELAAPHRHRRAGGDLGVDAVEEVAGRAELDRRHAVEVGHPPLPLEHLARRAAAAVAVAERHQRPSAPRVLGEAAHRVGHLLGHDLGVVGVDGREVGEHAGAVDALPPERRVREAVLAVPRQLLGDEAVHPAGHEHLRQPGRVAEHVGDPHLAAADAELLLEEALPEHDLAHDRLA